MSIRSPNPRTAPAKRPNPSHVRLGAHYTSGSGDAFPGALRGTATERAADPRPSALDILIAALEGESEPGEAPATVTDPRPDLAALLDLLPPRDADTVELYLSGEPPRSQYELAEIFGETQSGISYRLQAAVQRLRWHVRWGWLTPEKMRTALEAAGFDSDKIDILVTYWETGGQNETARLLGIGQGAVRHRTITSLERLARTPGCEAISNGLHELFTVGPILCGIKADPENRPGRKRGQVEPGRKRPEQVDFKQVLTVSGRSMTISEWAAETGIPARTIYHRAYKGWPHERAVSEPVRESTYTAQFGGGSK